MKNTKDLTLADVRQQIDTIDSQFLALLKKRLLCAKKIGELKNQNNKAKWDPLRERQIFERLLAENNNEFPEEPLLSIFHEIITTCRLSQKNVEVAYLGPEATFSHLAGVKYFGHAADYLPLETIEDIFDEVERGRSQYGIVPVENSIEGAVTSTLDSFIKYNVKICGELNLDIVQNLVNKSGSLDDIKLVVSHPQPIAQCRQWLKKHLPNVTVQEVSSTSAAAKMAAEDPSVAALASSLAIGKESPSRSGKDKTSLLVSLLDRPGALNDALSILAQRSINLTRIESRPVKDEPGRYLFFIDMLGHLEDEVVRDGCEKLKEICSYFEWLGSYPRLGE
jgi:chorismate mutase/prephenate dehydratase